MWVASIFVMALCMYANRKPARRWQSHCTLALAAIIEGSPNEHLTFLTTSFGKSFTAAGFGNWFREQCNEAGLPKRCSAHGLRKAACRRLAEAWMQRKRHCGYQRSLHFY